MLTDSLLLKWIVLSTALLGYPCIAHAQPHVPNPAELAVRRQLIDQALREHETGNHQASLEHALQALRIQSSASLLELIATEQNLTGRYADALSSAEQCRTLVRDPNHLVQDRQRVMESCDQLIATLPARAGRLVLVVAADAPLELQITVAGNPVSSAVFNLPYFVNPGTVHIEAQLDGQTFLNRDVVFAVGATVSLPINIPTRRSGPNHQPVIVSDVRPLSPGPLVVLGAAGAGFIASGVVFALRENTLAQLRSSCDQQTMPGMRGCPDTPTNRQNLNNLETFNTTTNVLVAVSTAVTVAGVAWLVVDRVTATRTPSTQTRVLLSPTGMFLQGSW